MQRDAEKQARQDEKIKEYNEREAAVKQKQIEKDQFDQKWGPRLSTWAKDSGAKPKPIRSLLSSMHTVLWKGARWKELGLGKLLQPNQVKLGYRKAMLVVHPDKVAGGDNVQIFIAEKVFAALQDAWGVFEANEMK